MNQLGRLFHPKSLHAQAEPLYHRALAITEASLGPDHPTVGINLNNLAGLLQATNRLAEAEPFYRRALAIAEKTFGPDHPRVATGLNNLALLLQDTNRLSEAELLMCRHLAIFIRFGRKTGHPHPHHEAALRNYSNWRRWPPRPALVVASSPTFSSSPRKRVTEEKVIKSAALDARFRGHDDEVAGWRTSWPY
jgi:tetratricopeptide (TPR) repeat protein